MSCRSGIGYDAHRFAEGRRLVLGGVHIEAAERGLAGHSDADVLTHAIIDALLGAAGLGDIGQRYPDTEERWRDADSLLLLEDTRRALERQGWRPRHLDATVLCERPRLDAHRHAMCGRLAGATELREEDVSVKLTTNEGMGFVGRGEGIAALATATLERVG